MADGEDTRAGEDLCPEEEVVEGDWMRPKLDMKEVQVATGEEDEEVFWQHRAKLFRWSKDTAAWKERGLGEAKILKHKTTNKIRFLLRQEKTLKIVANHYLFKHGTFCELKPHVSSDKIWVWSVTDYSEAEPCVEQFALKLGQLETATEFKEKFNEAVRLNAVAFSKEASNVVSAEKEDTTKSGTDEKKTTLSADDENGTTTDAPDTTANQAPTS